MLRRRRRRQWSVPWGWGVWVQSVYPRRPAGAMILRPSGKGGGAREQSADGGRGEEGGGRGELACGMAASHAPPPAHVCYAGHWHGQCQCTGARLPRRQLPQQTPHPTPPHPRGCLWPGPASRGRLRPAAWPAVWIPGCGPGCPGSPWPTGSSCKWPASPAGEPCLLHLLRGRPPRAARVRTQQL